MGTEYLIERFKEEIDIINNSKTILVIAYGSRITGHNTSRSDLDIFIVADSKHSYRICRLIDGIDVEMTLISINDLEDLILYDYSVNNNYFKSVLATGLLIKDKENVAEYIKDMLKKQIPMTNKKSISAKIINELNSLLKNFESTINPEMADYYFFNSLEIIRKIYYQQNNLSFINYSKLYELYKDSLYAENVYKLDLPNEEFRELFIKAIDSRDQEERFNILEKLKILINYSNLKGPLTIMDKSKFIDKDFILRQLSHLNRKVCRLEEMLINEYPFKEYVYYVLIKELKDFYLSIYHFMDDDLEVIIQNALNAIDTEQRIYYIEELFCFVDKEYRFDYDDYCLRYY